MRRQRPEALMDADGVITSLFAQLSAAVPAPVLLTYCDGSWSKTMNAVLASILTTRSVVRALAAMYRSFQRRRLCLSEDRRTDGRTVD